jgi:hypothetical protein
METAGSSETLVNILRGVTSETRVIVVVIDVGAPNIRPKNLF